MYCGELISVRKPHGQNSIIAGRWFIVEQTAFFQDATLSGVPFPAHLELKLEI